MWVAGGLFALPLSGYAIAAYADVTRHAFPILLLGAIEAVVRAEAALLARGPSSLAAWWRAPLKMSRRSGVALGTAIGAVVGGVALLRAQADRPAVERVLGSFTYGKYLTRYSAWPRVMGRFTPSQEAAIGELKAALAASPPPQLWVDGILIEVVDYWAGSQLAPKLAFDPTLLARRSLEDRSSPAVFETPDGFEGLPALRRTLLVITWRDVEPWLEPGSVWVIARERGALVEWAERMLVAGVLEALPLSEAARSEVWAARVVAAPAAPLARAGREPERALGSQARAALAWLRQTHPDEYQRYLTETETRFGWRLLEPKSRR